MKEKALEIQCSHCETTLCEFIENEKYPDGAIRFVRRHHGKWHTTIIPLAKALPDKVGQKDASKVKRAPTRYRMPEALFEDQETVL